MAASEEGRREHFIVEVKDVAIESDSSVSHKHLVFFIPSRIPNKNLAQKWTHAQTSSKIRLRMTIFTAPSSGRATSPLSYASV